MVGKLMRAKSREKIASRIHAVKHGGATAEDICSKLDQLRMLQNELVGVESVLLVEFIAPLLELLSDRVSPVRRFITQMVGQIGLKHLEFLPEIVPALINVLNDDTPAVARQAVTCGIEIFRSTLVEVAIQGMYSSEFNESLKSSWASAQQFRDEIYSMAFKAGSDGRRLPALKFVESVVLLYSPDPNGSLEPPSGQLSEEKFGEFNVSWIRGGHPTLNAGDLSVEASRSLGLLLDQLRLPTVKSMSSLMIIVLVKSLSALARKRPAFYGRILPVLLGLGPSSKGMHLARVHPALKNAFECCLDCTHTGAAPWRDRLISALKDMKLENNGVAGLSDDSHTDEIHVDVKPSIVASDTEQNSSGKKRSGSQDNSYLSKDGKTGKRSKSSPEVTTPSRSDADSGHVQQLVAMFSGLISQGEKAAASLEILIASISADLLAEVVMANLRNLPPSYLKAEGDDEETLVETGAHSGAGESGTHIRDLALLLTEILSQTSSSPMKEIGVEAHRHAESNEPEQNLDEETPHVTLGDDSSAYNGSNHAIEQERVSISEPASREDHDDVIGENEIPGLTLSTQDDKLPENATVLSIDLEDSNREKVTNLGSSLIELAESLSNDRSEELIFKPEMTEATSNNSSSSTLIETFKPLILPKMSAPVVGLSDEQKDQLQELAFVRIVEAYKQVTVAGGCQVRFSILAHSGIEFPSELDPWKILKTHISADYVNHEGHELTLRVLYRLFGEAEEERDFFSATTATSVYETFLLQVAETLRDSFPSSDKSLNRLLCEVPYLPKSLFKMLECLCSPGSGDNDDDDDNDDKELQGGDRVTQGLSIVWSMILQRPPIRDDSLKIALQSATHHLDEVRMKAIRLVANKLYPLPSISSKIEDFAKEKLLSVVSDDQHEADRPHTELPKDEKPSNENLSVTTETHHLAAPESIPSSTVAEVQSCMSLYFALCTKKHSLFRLIFYAYERMSKAAKEAVHLQLPLLIRTMGSSRDLLDMMSDPPAGSKELLIQVLHTLTDGTVPSPDLTSTIKRLYDTKLKEVEILIPILPFLSKEEVLRVFPYLVNAPLDKFQVTLSRVLQGFNRSSPMLTPAEALIAIHGIDPDRDGVPLKKVTDACNACFEQRQIFTQQVLAKVLNQLVEQIPLPLLFMRTVLQAIGAFPSLVGFIMEILSRLVNKQIWKYPKLWVGFMKCALMTKPQSFSVLLQLPSAQLENALNRTPALKSPLVEHVNQPHIRSSLPRSTLVVLGLTPSDAPTSSHVKPTESEAVETGNLEKEAVTDELKESSSTAS